MREKALVFDILIRYAVLILIAVPNFWIFYTVFTPLTVWPVFGLLNIFYDAFLVSGRVILINRTVPIELIGACIAGAAYYLLLILNLSTREIKLKKRLIMISFSFLVFLIVNILRIFVLSVIAVSGYSGAFAITHWLFWYALSTIFVVAIWFAEVKKFSIKAVPFYSDIIFLLKHKKRKRRKR